MRIAILSVGLMACGGNYVVAEMTDFDIRDYCRESEVNPDPEVITCDDGTRWSDAGATVADCNASMQSTRDLFRDRECDVTTSDFERCEAGNRANPCSDSFGPRCQEIFECYFSE
ncbi:MAG: hypothetical protein ACJATT_005637 [Myxococcota bacterium]|jgi:hypothetical protein